MSFSDSPFDTDGFRRRLVCRSCHIVMRDCEPATQGGEFWHGAQFSDGKTNKCQNVGKSFTTESPECMPYLRKGQRRAMKRTEKRSPR